MAIRLKATANRSERIGILDSTTVVIDAAFADEHWLQERVVQEPVRDVYRGFEILLILRHVDDGRIETTVFINPTATTAPALVQAAKQLGSSVLHAPEAATPITDQMEAAHRIVDKLMDSYTG